MHNGKIFEEYIKSTYIELTALSQKESGNTYLAKNRINGMIVVKKQVNTPIGKIYECLRSIKSPYLTEIQEICYCDNYCIIIESYVSGETLEQKLERNPSLSVKETESYSLQILQCLDQIHKAGIVHRDLTPSNVLISTDGVVKLIDFGIARSPKDNQSKDTTILGTAGYAAPEQFGFSQTDGRTDIYAFGILLNKMLTGSFPSEELTEIKKYREIIEKCTMLDPQERYETVDEILDVLKGKYIKKDKTIWPGFRSDILWHKIVAIFGYSLMSLLGVSMISSNGITIQTFFLECTAFFLYMVIPFLVGSNWGRWDRKWKPFTYMPKPLCIFFRIILMIIFFSCGIELENYIEQTLLNLPVP